MGIKERTLSVNNIVANRARKEMHKSHRTDDERSVHKRGNNDFSVYIRVAVSLSLYLLLSLSLVPIMMRQSDDFLQEWERKKNTQLAILLLVGIPQDIQERRDHNAPWWQMIFFSLRCLPLLHLHTKLYIVSFWIRYFARATTTLDDMCTYTIIHHTEMKSQEKLFLPDISFRIRVIKDAWKFTIHMRIQMTAFLFFSMWIFWIYFFYGNFERATNSCENCVLYQTRDMLV